MTDQEAVVFEALARGRLIFPFKQEMSDLRAMEGPLTDDESDRLADLSDAFEKIKVKDKWFHSAMEGGDTETAGKVAGEALAILEELE